MGSCVQQITGLCEGFRVPLAHVYKLFLRLQGSVKFVACVSRITDSVFLLYGWDGGPSNEPGSFNQVWFLVRDTAGESASWWKTVVSCDLA